MPGHKAKANAKVDTPGRDPKKQKRLFELTFV